MNINERLKEERERLRYTQTTFAELGGASKGSQIAWERGTAYPNAKFLEDIAAKGADVQYIVTGHRSLNPPSDLSAFDYRQNLLSNISRKVSALKLSDKYLAANLQNILFFAELGKPDDVVEAMQDYAGSNLTIAEKDLIAAYRKAAEIDRTLIDRLAQLTEKAAEDESQTGEVENNPTRENDDE